MNTFTSTTLSAVLLTALVGWSPSAFAIDWTFTEAAQHPHVEFSLPSNTASSTHQLSMRVVYKDTRHRTRKHDTVCRLALGQNGSSLTCGNLDPVEITPDMLTVNNGTTHFSVPLLSIEEWEATSGNRFVSLEAGSKDSAAGYIKWKWKWDTWPLYGHWECSADQQDQLKCQAQCAPNWGLATVEMRNQTYTLAECRVVCECTDGSLNRGPWDIGPIIEAD